MIIVDIAVLSWFLWSFDSFFPLAAFANCADMFWTTHLAFSTEATSLSLATLLGSIVFRNPTTAATSPIAVGVVPCNSLSVVLACVIFVCVISLTVSYDDFLDFANSISSGVLYQSFFFASISDIPSFSACLTMFCDAVALSSLDPNPPTNAIAFIMLSVLFSFVAGHCADVLSADAVGFVGINPPLVPAISPSGIKSFDSFSSPP